LVNDCSPDNCQNIIEEHTKKDKRIIMIKHEINQGVSVARNDGMNIAKGEYIGFVDSDDYIDLNFYEKLYNEAKNNEYPDVVKGNVKITDFNGKTKIENINKDIRKNKFHFAWQFWSAIYKNSFIQKNKIDFPSGIIVIQDDVFLTKVNILIKKIVTIDDIFYNYIRVEDSLNSPILSKKKIKSNIDAMKLIIEIINLGIISKENYFFIFIMRLVYLKSMFGRVSNQDDESKQLIVRELIELYDMCKYKDEFLMDSRTEKWYEFLADENKHRSYRLYKLYDYLNSEYVKYEVYRIKLFNFVPLLKIKLTAKFIHAKLFGFIPLFGIKRK
jgi:glycosyltransferase involved in cell wall biosynthesis